MSDFTDDLIKQIHNLYASYKESDESLASLLKRCEESQTYEDAYEYAKKAGFDLEKAIIEAWGNNGEAYFGTMADMLIGSTADLKDDVDAVCDFIQANKNAAQGINVAAQRASVNESDLKDIADKMRAKPIEDINGRVATYGCKVVDDNQMENVKFQTSLGYDVVIKREYDGVGLRNGSAYSEACQYCLDRAGVFEFKSAKEASGSGVFGRHPGCGCTIDYECKSSGTKTKDVRNYSTGVNKIVRLKEKEDINLQNRGIQEQNRQIVKNLNDKKIIERNKDVNTFAVNDSQYHTYVSENSKIKQGGLDNIEKAINDSLERLKISDASNFPNVYVLTQNEMGTSAFASYNTVKNELYLSDVIGNKTQTRLYQNQFGFVSPNDPFSTVRHEVIHWKTDDEYRRAGGIINAENVTNYLQNKHNGAKIHLDSLGIQGISEAYAISDYAGTSYLNGEFDETLTEFITKGDK